MKLAYDVFDLADDLIAYAEDNGFDTLDAFQLAEDIGDALGDVPDKHRKVIECMRGICFAGKDPEEESCPACDALEAKERWEFEFLCKLWIDAYREGLSSGIELFAARLAAAACEAWKAYSRPKVESAICLGAGSRKLDTSDVLIAGEILPTGTCVVSRPVFRSKV